MAFLYGTGLDGREAVLSLSKADKRDAQAIFRGEIPGKAACEDCGGIHQRACPRVKRQVWVGQGAAAGTRTEVEYWAEFDQTGIIWPEDAFDPSDDDEGAANG